MAGNENSGRRPTDWRDKAEEKFAALCERILREVPNGHTASLFETIVYTLLEPSLVEPGPFGAPIPKSAKCTNCGAEYEPVPAIRVNAKVIRDTIFALTDRAYGTPRQTLELNDKRSVAIVDAKELTEEEWTRAYAGVEDADSDKRGDA